MGTAQRNWLVEIDFRRIQEFLFGVPRKRAMEGANVLVGETARLRLLAAFLEVQPPPHLGTPPSGTSASDCLIEALGQLQNDATRPEVDDELRSLINPMDLASGWLRDDPARDWVAGVVARDGGKFHALLESDDKVQTFVKKAHDVLHRYTPGLRYGLVIKEWRQDRWQEHAELTASCAAPVRRVADIASIARCHELLSPMAVSRMETPEGSKRVSAAVKLRYDWGKRFWRHQPIPPSEKATKWGSHEASHSTLDLVSLLRPLMPLYQPNWVFPTDFDALANGRYMAVIHIDGNGMGRRAATVRQEAVRGATSRVGWEEAEKAVGELYADMRYVVRGALVSALKGVFANEADVQKQAKVAGKDEAGRTLHHRPYQVMMLGGDDLLLVCRADYAMPFVIQYAREIRTRSKEVPSFQSDPLTVGAGVVIARASTPFSSLHAASEALADSAKSLARLLENPDGCSSGTGRSPSVMDWHVTTDSWIHDPLLQRAQACLVPGKDPQTVARASRRPYRILADTSGSSADAFCLETLWRVAETLRKESASAAGMNGRRELARSQVKRLGDTLQTGYWVAKLAWQELPAHIRQPFVDELLATATSPWHSDGDAYFSAVGDAAELAEIADLGAAPPTGGDSR